MGPRTGMLPSRGTEKGVNPGADRPTNGVPRKFASPAPRMVRASPETTWLPWNHKQTTPCRQLNRAAPRPPARKASQGLPVTMEARKAHMAPMSIMPSTPRLSTPDRSVMISPTVAYRMGVPDCTAAVNKGTRISMCMHCSRSRALPHRMAGASRSAPVIFPFGVMNAI